MRTTLTKKAVDALNNMANKYQLGLATPSEVIIRMSEDISGVAEVNPPVVAEVKPPVVAEVTTGVRM